MGSSAPKINGAIQPKVNCFLVSIFFVQALAMWKTVLKCASCGFACFLKCSLSRAVAGGRAGCAGRGTRRSGAVPAGRDGAPAARSARAPPGAKAPFLGWVLGGPAVRMLCITERQTGSPLGTESGPILHRLGEALPSLPFGPKSSCLCRPKQIPDGAGKILSLLNV